MMCIEVHSRHMLIRLNPPRAPPSEACEKPTESSFADLRATLESESSSSLSSSLSSRSETTPVDTELVPQSVKAPQRRETTRNGSNRLPTVTAVTTAKIDYSVLGMSEDLDQLLALRSDFIQSFWSPWEAAVTVQVRLRRRRRTATIVDTGIPMFSNQTGQLSPQSTRRLTMPQLKQMRKRQTTTTTGRG